MVTVYLTTARRDTILNRVVNNSQSLDTTFAALADPTRRAILAQLALGMSTVTQLAEPFDISLPAVSKHLRVLEDAGLLVRQKDGRVHRCTLDPGPMTRAAEWIGEMRRFWESQFDALAAYLERTKEESWPRSRHSLKAPRSRSRSGAPSPRRGPKSSARGRTRKR
ncbi:MAG TPA: metalloregulator ArsR/SmtB family transcription factor [Thermoanaerobaculia bacterium]